MKWLILFVFFGVGSPALTQSFQLARFAVRDGLSNNDIRDVIKDRNGFLWVATGNGLNRFDGNAFDHFYNDPTDEHSLPGNEIMSLYTDKKENVWVGTLAGISRFDPVKQQFHNYYPDSSNGKCGRWFTAMEEDRTGKLWVGSWYELLLFDPVREKFERSGWAEFAASHKPLKGNNNRILILDLMHKSANELWILTTYGLYSVNISTKAFTWYPYEGIDDYYGCQLNYTDDVNDPWIGTYNHGLLHYVSSTKKWTAYIPPAATGNKTAGLKSVYGVNAYHGDTILYCGIEGLAFFDRHTSQFIRHIPGIPSTPASIYKTVSDKGRYWFSSGEGLVCMYPLRSQFVQTAPFGDNSFVNRAYAIKGFPDEYLLYDPSAKKVIRWNSVTQIRVNVPVKGNLSIPDEITGWYQKNNDCYISTDENLYRYDLRTNLAQPINLPPSLFPSNDRTVRNIVFDKSGIGWIRLRTQGIVRYDAASGATNFASFILPELDRSYAALQYDATSHCLWIAVENGGLYRYDIASNKVVHFPIFRKQGGINEANITSLASMPNGDIYASDAAEGIIYYEKQTGQFTRFTMADGLPGNNCNALLPDHQGRIWVATSQGISRYDPKDRSFINFTPDDVLPAYLSFISSADGKQMITCYGSYFYSWDADALTGTLAEAPLYMRKVTINNKPVALANAYTLSHWENTISLQAGIITEGLNSLPILEYSVTNGNEWSKMDNGHTVSFSRLPPGHYPIRIRQKGNPHILTVDIQILPPWWKRKFFLFAVVAALLAFGVWLYKRRIHQIRKAALLKQKITETEIMALRAQMNPHFIFNCISSIDNFIQDNDKENASAWLSKFAKLIRSILDSSKNEVVPFWKDWETLQLYLEMEQLRSDKAFTTELNAAPELLNGHYRVPPLIIQPFVENAIHHGLLHRNDRNGQLRITASLKDQVLVYTI
ncbi:MAG: histidine kinase, partial [Bacteroidetes bacterium]|nr:histidine kinase [Bacteroidota bacterium]